MGQSGYSPHVAPRESKGLRFWRWLAFAAIVGACLMLGFTHKTQAHAQSPAGDGVGYFINSKDKSWQYGVKGNIRTLDANFTWDWVSTTDNDLATLWTGTGLTYTRKRLFGWDVDGFASFGGVFKWREQIFSAPTALYFGVGVKY
jgi:hypothetical protein